MTAWQMYLCDRCQQPCFNPIVVDIGPAKTQVCFSCFEDAVKRSNGMVIATFDGGVNVLLDNRPIVPHD